MNLLVMTGIYPSTRQPSAGIFVRNQYQRLCASSLRDGRCDLFYMRRGQRSATGRLIAALGAVLRFAAYPLRRYDVIHVHFLGPHIFGALFYRFLHPSCKTLLTMHGGDIKTRLPRDGLRNRCYRWAIRRFDLLIASGPALNKLIQKRLGRKVDVNLCAGIDRAVFHRTGQIGKEYDFIFVGSFTHHKGVDIILNALDALDDSELKVCFVGNGQLHADIRRKSQIHDIRVFSDVGQHQLRELYAASRFLVFPSRGDGFGLVVTEAMYCGTPAIVFAESGAEGQVRHNYNGLVYKSNTADKLARTLRDAAQMDSALYTKLSDNAANSNRDHALDRVVEQLHELYTGLLADPVVQHR